MVVIFTGCSVAIVKKTYVIAAMFLAINDAKGQENRAAIFQINGRALCDTNWTAKVRKACISLEDAQAFVEIDISAVKVDFMVHKIDFDGACSRNRKESGKEALPRVFAQRKGKPESW